jgi:hypothetical protein
LTRARKLLTAAAAVAVVLVGLSFASAAGLSVSGGSISAAAATHPCPGTATATAPTGTATATVATGSGLTYLTASVTVPAGCAGKMVTLRMTSGATVLTGTAAVNASNVAAVSFAPTTYNATSAWTILAVVDGWDLPTTWSFTLPPIWCTVTNSTTATCTATVTLFTGLKPGGTASASYYDVVVQTTSASWVQWEVGFNLGSTFYGGVPSRLGNADTDGYDDGDLHWGQGGDVNDISRISACSAKPVLSVVGIDSGDSGDHFYNIRNDRERRFSLVLNRTEAGYFDVVSPGCGW